MYDSSEGGWVCGNRQDAKIYATVGSPAKYQEFQIVDTEGNPCPSGVEGEVTVGGPQCRVAALSPEAAATGVPDNIYGEEVVCYIVAKPGETLTNEQIMQHCALTRPEYKVPKQVCFVTELPKNDRGKVKRDVLKEQWMTARARLNC